jgi:membrane protein
MPDRDHSLPEASRAALSHTLEVWQLGGLSWWDLVRQTWKEYRANQCDARGAQFAYYSLLAIFPLLILLLAAVAQFPWQGILESALDAADRGLPESAADLLRRQVRDIQEHSTVGLISANLLVLLIAGSRVFLTITDGLNAVYGVRETRRFWQMYGMAFLSTLAVSLLVLGAMTLMIVGPMTSQWLTEQDFAIVWLEVLLRRGVRWLVICSALWVYTSTIYSLGPNLRLPWYWLSPGSVVATAGWVIVTQGFRIYVENFANYNQTYGALGGVIVLIVWLDLTGVVLMLGGQVNAVIYRAAKQGKQAAPPVRTSTPAG